MTANELIKELEKVPPNSEVFMGYDGDIVVEHSVGVEYILAENQIGDVWCGVEVGSTVILSDKRSLG